MRRNEEFVIRDIGGQSVLVPLSSQMPLIHGLFILNDTARYLWDLLAEDRSFDDLVNLMASQYHMARPTAQVDIQSFLDEIMSANFSTLIHK